MSVTWFITGTSRGIGLQFCKQLTDDPQNIVIATCRKPESAHDLKALEEKAKGRLHIVKLDVEDASTFQPAADAAAKIVGDLGIDYLLNNAGVNPGDDKAFNVTAQDLEYSFRNNVIGPALIAQAVLPLLEKGRRKVIMNMTSGLASIGLNIGDKCTAYSISKAAVNMLTYKMKSNRPDIIAVVVDPGWVKTVMGGEGAFLEPEESVTPFIKLLTGLTTADSGKFFDYKGNTKPW